jgi:molecular chaperone GrpE (heat shock protein)
MAENLNNDNGESATNCMVEKESNMQEPDTPTADQSFTISEAEWTAIKALLDKRYTEIATLLRYNKTKDESIQRLSAEIQKYREGFAFSALKPFINVLISLREDCRKSIRDAKQFAPDNEKIKKYIEYLVSDFEEMLANVGLERNGNSISINGKSLSGLTQPRVSPEIPLTDEQKDNDSSQILICAEQIKSVSDLIECLNKSEAAIRLALQDRAAADKIIQEYIALVARTDAEHYLALAAPVSRQIYDLYDKISAKSKSAGNYSDEALIKFYIEILRVVGKGIEVILTEAGVKIEILKGVFDTQKHKLVKTIPTNDEKLDRFITNIYTDCYIYDEKVIYQSKVDVYKYQNLTQGEQNHG